MYRKFSMKWSSSFSDDTMSNRIQPMLFIKAFKSDDIIKQGYLSKQSAHLKAVRKRWMVLKRDCLYSYKDIKKPSETFNFSIYDSVQRIDYDSFKFELLSTSERMSRVFIADSEEERNQWLDTIKQVQSNRYYKNWNYKKALKAKSNKLQKLGYKKAHITTAFMNCVQIHNPTDDPIDSDDAQYKEENELNHDQQHIIDQLSRFGYSKSESIDAMHNVQNKYDINSITDYLHNKAYNTDTINNVSDTECSISISVHEDSKQWELLLDQMTSRIPSEQQLLIFLKLKILAQGMITKQSISKYHRLSMNDTKLQQTLLKLNGGLMFLSELGFERDAECADTLICSNVDTDAVKLCIKCLQNRMQLLSKNVDFGRYRSGTISDNIIAISRGTKQSQTVHNITDDAIDTDASDYSDTMIKEQSTEDLCGATKQFHKFLEQHNLVKYFDSFRQKECCNIGDIEYLMDDDEKFLENDIGINNSFHRKKLVGECKKLKAKMDDFQDSHLMPAMIIKQLATNGVVTMDILMDEVEHRSDLRTKLGVIDEKQCDLIWNIIRLQSNTQQEHECEQEGVQIVHVASNETNYMSR